MYRASPNTLIYFTWKGKVGYVEKQKKWKIYLPGKSQLVITP